MKDYQAFRKLLKDRGLTYLYRDDPDRYDIYREFWGTCPPRSIDFLISIPAQMARRDVAEAHDLIRTALELEVMFGS